MYALTLLLFCQLPPLPPAIEFSSRASNDAAVIRADAAPTLRDTAEGLASTTLANPAARGTDAPGTAVVSLPAMFDHSIAEQMAAASNSYLPRPLEPTLTAAAQDYANVLAGTRMQGHFVQGSDVEGRVRRFGFTGTIAGPVTISRIDGKPCRGLGEVIHYGSPTISGAFASLMKSDGHRDAITEPSYDVAGFGYSVNRYTGQPIYVGVYGNSKSSAPAPAATPNPAARAAVSYPTCGPGGCQPAAIGPSYQRRGLFGGRR